MSFSDYDAIAPVSAPYQTPPALIAFTLGVLVLCFVAFSIVYLCKYCFSNVVHTWAFQRTASGSLIGLSTHRSPPRGLDPSLLDVFPTFPYSSVRDLRKDQTYGLECAICLFEFEDDNVLRLLTLCCHVFHQDCIDLWLSSHKTCPVCRRNLDSPAEETGKSAAVVITSTSQGEIHIDVREEGQDHVNSENIKQESRHAESEHEHECAHDEGVMFTRSHSTGHSIVLIRGEGDEGKDDDKYTLRLPEHVLRVRQNRHNCTRSCASYKDIAGPFAAATCSNCGFVQPVPARSSSPEHTQKS